MLSVVHQDITATTTAPVILHFFRKNGMEPFAKQVENLADFGYNQRGWRLGSVDLCRDWNLAKAARLDQAAQIAS